MSVGAMFDLYFLCLSCDEVYSRTALFYRVQFILLYIHFTNAQAGSQFLGLPATRTGHRYTTRDCITINRIPRQEPVQ